MTKVYLRMVLTICRRAEARGDTYYTRRRLDERAGRKDERCSI